MTRTLTPARIGFLALAIAVAGFAAPAGATWSLVWSDEFNGTSLDATNWTPDIGNGCPSLCGWGNNELEYYRAENVAVTGGNLVITTKAESYGGNSFTSGKIHTRGKQSFLYGRIEMRAKIPTGGGMWPAFWMMPQDSYYGGWAASGEIDIMESSNATTEVGGALHFGGGWPDNVSTSSSYSLGGASFADDFHLYAVEWEPDQIRWYVDDVHYATRTSSQWYSDGDPSNPRAPFDQEFYIILNAAVGGWYTGCTDPGCVTADLPQQYLVDYVRVYQDIPNDPPTVAITAPANGAVLPAGDVAIAATASDPDGTVAAVEFYDDATLLATDTTAPYAYTWTGVPDGCYRIVARVIDDLGGTAVDEVDVTVGAGCGQTGYHGSPLTLPARVEVEDFDEGGEGVAYHDVDAGNNGGQYRPAEGVDLETCYDTGGGYNAGWVEAGEWMEYAVEAPVTGAYTVDVRVASLSTGGAFRLDFDGEDLSGQVNVPVTGGWQNWATVSRTLPLEAGAHTMRFTALTDGFNVNYFDFTGVDVTDVPAPGAARHALLPCFPNPFNPTTTLRFDLAEPAAVRLAVYDVSGALVRTLVDAEALGPGRHERRWDGRDDAGAAAPAGVYFYRLDAGGWSETRRMALIK